MSGRRIVGNVRRALERQPRSESIFGFPPSVSLSEVLLLMLVDEPELLHRPLLPLGELFEGSDLEVHRGWVGYPGTDWEALDEFMAWDEAWDDADLENLPVFDEEWPSRTTTCPTWTPMRRPMR